MENNFGGPGGFKPGGSNSFESIGPGGKPSVEAYDSIDAVVNVKVLVEMLGIGLCLIVISSTSAMISIQRFSPLTILKERS